MLRNENTRGATGYCLEVHDLVVAKAVAGREKDRAFVREVIRHRLVQLATLLDRLERTPIDRERQSALSDRLRADFAELQGSGNL